MHNDEKQTLELGVTLAEFRKKLFSFKDIETKLVSWRIKAGFTGGLFIYTLKSFVSLSDNNKIIILLSDNSIYDFVKGVFCVIFLSTYIFSLLQSWNYQRKQKRFLKEEL